MFKKIWGYIKTLLGMKADSMMKETVQLRQLKDHAAAQHRDLYQKVQNVVAQKEDFALQLERAGREAAEALEYATVAVQKKQAAITSGNEQDVALWTQTAQQAAYALQNAEQAVEQQKQILAGAEGSAQIAQQNLRDNEMRQAQLDTQIKVLTGKLKHAEMQEATTATLQSISSTAIVDSAPTLREIEDKINTRMAHATAGATLENNSLQGAQRQVQSAMLESAGNDRLAALEASLAPASTLSAPEKVEVPAEQA